MPKDPAFLFYPNDYVGGTMTMSFIQKGAYVDLLILQFNKGPFTKSDIKNILRGQFEKIWPALEDKFIHEEGKYYNQRLKNEIEKRKAHSLKQKENVVKRWNKSGNTVVIPLENENENRDSGKGLQGEGIPIGSEKVSEIANEVWKDQKWRESLCMGMNIKEGDLKKWMAQFNSSIANDVINNFNQHSYKKIIRGWIANEQGKGRTINTTNRESLSAPLKHLS